jgi:hypothetical protein
MSKKKRKTELRREDVVTYADKLRYSRQVWEQEQEKLASWDMGMFDFKIEEHEWENGHFWLNEGMRQRAANKLAKELGIIDDKKKR